MLLQLPKDAVDLLRKLLELNPAKRITSMEALFVSNAPQHSTARHGASAHTPCLPDPSCACALSAPACAPMRLPACLPSAHSHAAGPASFARTLTLLLPADPSCTLTSLPACPHVQHDYFTKSDVKPCAKKDLPKLPDCHEWTTKKRKQQHPQQHPHGPAGHVPGYGHVPHPGVCGGVLLASCRSLLPPLHMTSTGHIPSGSCCGSNLSSW